MKVYAEPKYANQELILPFAGKVKLDGDASFDVSNDVAGLLIDTDLSIKFDDKPVVGVLPKKAQAQRQQSVETSAQPEKPKSAKELLDAVVQAVGREQVLKWLGVEPIKLEPAPANQAEVKSTEVDDKQAKSDADEKDETSSLPVDDEMIDSLIEDLKEANVDQLRDLVDLVPGVNKKRAQKLSGEELRAFLLLKLNEAKKVKT